MSRVLQLEIDELSPVAEMLHYLGFAEIKEGDILLTPAARNFADLDTQTRKKVFAHHLLASALDLAIQPLERIGRVDLGPVIFGEAHKREHVGFCLVHQGCQLGDLGSDLIGDLAPLATSGFGIFLGKCGGNEGGDDATAPACRRGPAHCA